jgi:hypothetical protein
MADNTAVATLIFDASGAKKGAADFQAAGKIAFQNFRLCDSATRHSGYASATARRAPIVSAAS